MSVGEDDAVPFELLDEEDGDSVEAFKLLDESEEPPPEKRPRIGESSSSIAASGNLMYQAQLAYSSNRVDEAWELCRDIVRSNPALHEPYLLMSQIEMDRNGSSRVYATLLFISCVRNPGTTALQWLQVADLAEADSTQRMTAWESALKLDSTLVEARRKRADYFGCSQLAFQDLRALWIHQCQHQSEASVELTERFSRVCLQLGLVEEGLLALRSLGDKCLSDASLAACLAELYVGAGRVADAAAFLGKLKEPMSDLLLALKGAVQARLGVWNLARDEWSKLAKQSGRSALVVAQALCLGKFNDEARVWLEAARNDPSCFAEVEFARALLLEQVGAVRESLSVIGELLKGNFCFSGMQELLLRHSDLELSQTLARKLSELSARIFQMPNVATDDLPASEAGLKEVTSNSSAFQIGGWRHAVPEKGGDEVELAPLDRMTPKTFYLRVLELFETGRVGELLRFTAPVLEADESRRLRNGRLPERPPRKGNLQYLANELSERKYVLMFGIVLRCLVHVNNFRDAGRYLEELFRMEFHRSSHQHDLCKTAFALGFPFLESQLPIALRHFRSAVAGDRNSLFLWLHFGYLACTRVDLYRHIQAFILTNSKQQKQSLYSLLLGGFLHTANSKPKKALPFFERAVMENPNDSVAALSLASCLLNMAQAGESEGVLKAFALVFNLRDVNPSWRLYNLARAYHHVGLLTEATKFYQECIASVERPPNQDSIAREAAFNLHLIYKASGNMALAREVLKQHFSF